MRTYYVVNGSLSFGFGGFIKKAFTTKEQAEQAMAQAKKRYSNITDISISEVQAKNKKEAEQGRPSMFANRFEGIDKVTV